MNYYRYILCIVRGHEWAIYPLVQVEADHPHPENVAMIRRCSRCGRYMLIPER